MWKVALCMLLAATYVKAQSGGGYEITQSVISNGGGTSSSGTFSITGTIGQPVAGTTSGRSPFNHTSGFWQTFFFPTAAPVSIGGRVETHNGQPIARMAVLLQDDIGSIRSVTTNSFGRFQFSQVQPGRTYILTVASRRHQFRPFTVQVDDHIADLVLVALANQR